MKFPAFYFTRKFITAFTSARHLSQSWASSIHSILTYSTSPWSFFFGYVAPKHQSGTEALFVNISKNDTFWRWGVISTSPNSQARGPPLVGYPQLLVEYFRIYPSYWWPFLHPQLEDVPLLTWPLFIDWWQGSTCHMAPLYRLVTATHLSHGHCL